MEGNEGQHDNPPPKNVARRTILAGIGAGVALGMAKLIQRNSKSDGSSISPTEQPQPKIPLTQPHDQEVELQPSRDLEMFTKLVTGDREKLDTVMQKHRTNIISRFDGRDIKEALKPYENTIHQTSQQYGINPILIEGIIGVESQGRPQIQGRWDPNDVGLLQQQPINVKEFLQEGERVYTYKEGESLKADDARLKPEIAIRIGAQDLQRTKIMFGGRDDLATLAFYIGSGTTTRLTENNLPSPTTTYYEWLNSPETQKRISMSGLTGEENYPLLVLAAAELTNENVK